MSALRTEFDHLGSYFSSAMPQTRYQINNEDRRVPWTIGNDKNRRLYSTIGDMNTIFSGPNSFLMDYRFLIQCERVSANNLITGLFISAFIGRFFHFPKVNQPRNKKLSYKEYMLLLINLLFCFLLFTPKRVRFN